MRLRDKTFKNYYPNFVPELRNFIHCAQIESTPKKGGIQKVLKKKTIANWIASWIASGMTSIMASSTAGLMTNLIVCLIASPTAGQITSLLGSIGQFDCQYIGQSNCQLNCQSKFQLNCQCDWFQL
jgi:propanediol dehydratase large subunit